MLVELAHFNNAKRYVAPLLVTGGIFAAIGLGLMGVVSARVSLHWIPDLISLPPLAYVGAALLVPAGGFLSTCIVTFVRDRLFDADLQSRTQPNGPVGAAQAESSDAAWPPVLVVLLFGLLAAVGVFVGWWVSARTALDPIVPQVLGGTLVVAAFPLLVLERSYAGLAAEMLPEAPQLERLLRVPLTACLGLGISMVLVSLGFGWGFWIERATALLIFVTALELILRSLAMCFIPFAPIERLRTVADSSVAGLLRFTAPNFQAFNVAVRQQFGIDLSRSWALAFIQRASLPIVVGLGLMAWGITGITALGLNQRAVYERFGSPVAVFGPGLHVHLPWPMGVMRDVELGVVHDIPIAISPTGDPTQPSHPSAGVDQQQQLVGAEAPAPPSADRLWNASHPAEQTYLIASEASGKQSFQVADADLRVVYRVGLSDAAALDFVYRVADPEVFIRAAAGQILVKHFSRYTLLDVLGQNRETFANEFRTALQDQLDRMSSGIEVIAVVIEAIHPPPGAAAAYHDVQAAEIFAKVEIALQRADAIRTAKTAEQEAMEERNRAIAGATELLDRTNSESVLFDADREAWQRDNQAFLLERRFERLVSGLAKSELIVIDHRLNGRNAPTIDLRNFNAAGSYPYPSGKNDGPDEDDGEFSGRSSQSKSGSKQ
ncbi:MAG TPA: SPFH domain-containing protein [Bradyrhizobium sp.]|nr:SPFH domain-containing protein [Bradyrhizobium sp.]